MLVCVGVTDNSWSLQPMVPVDDPEWLSPGSGTSGFLTQWLEVVAVQQVVVVTDEPGVQIPPNYNRGVVGGWVVRDVSLLWKSVGQATERHEEWLLE